MDLAYRAFDRVSWCGHSSSSNAGRLLGWSFKLNLGHYWEGISWIWNLRAAPTMIFFWLRLFVWGGVVLCGLCVLSPFCVSFFLFSRERGPFSSTLWAYWIIRNLNHLSNSKLREVCATYHCEVRNMSLKPLSVFCSAQLCSALLCPEKKWKKTTLHSRKRFFVVYGLNKKARIAWVQCHTQCHEKLSKKKRGFLRIKVKFPGVSFPCEKLLILP